MYNKVNFARYMCNLKKKSNIMWRKICLRTAFFWVITQFSSTSRRKPEITKKYAYSKFLPPSLKRITPPIKESECRNMWPVCEQQLDTRYLHGLFRNGLRDNHRGEYSYGEPLFSVAS